jgi:hypothetical protein
MTFLRDVNGGLAQAQAELDSAARRQASEQQRRAVAAFHLVTRSEHSRRYVVRWHKGAENRARDPRGLRSCTAKRGRWTCRRTSRRPRRSYWRRVCSASCSCCARATTPAFRSADACMDVRLVRAAH